MKTDGQRRPHAQDQEVLLRAGAFACFFVMRGRVKHEKIAQIRTH